LEKKRGAKMSEETPKVNLNSQDITQETIKELKKLIPSAFREGQIDFDALKSVLGDIVEPNHEFYNFTWAGKSDAFRHIQQPSIATLKPCKEESVDFDNTENIFIEGDNLEVLKLLQKSYYGKIKMIYIDPPYNKDKDFVYPDGKGYFDSPKQLRLMKQIFKISNLKKDDIILDFFAGSGTTTHAVMQLNAEDGGNRKSISVQLPEPTDKKSESYKAGYKRISEITKERLKRADKNSINPFETV